MKKSVITAVAAAAFALSSCCGGAKSGNESACCNNNAVCDSTCVCTPAESTSDERAAIEKALNFYTEAAVKGDSKIAMQGFAPAATMSYVEADSLVTVPIQALYDYYDQTGPHNATYTISGISVAGDVAMVRIESEFGEARFTDMFTLVKDGSDWKIVSKIYQPK